MKTCHYWQNITAAAAAAAAAAAGPFHWPIGAKPPIHHAQNCRP